MTVKDSHAAEDSRTVNAYQVSDILPGSPVENGRYVIVGLKLAGPEGSSCVTQMAFSAEKFDCFLMQLLDNSARARSERLKHNPPPEDAALNLEAAALPVVTSSAEPSIMRDGHALICLKMESRTDRRLACLHFSFDEASLEQLSETVQQALATVRHSASRGWHKSLN